MSRPLNNQSRANIVKTAHTLFYSKGYRGVSMDDIAKEAGIKKANLFHYYKTKEELVLEVLNSTVECFKSNLTEKLNNEKDPIQLVQNLFGASSKNMEKSGCCGGCFIGNISQELSDHNEQVRQKVAEYFSFWQSSLTDFFKKAIAEKTLAKNLKPQIAAAAIVSMIEGSMLLSKTHKQTQIFDQAGQFVADYLKQYQNRR